MTLTANQIKKTHSVKIPFDQLDPMGFRKCNWCGELEHCRRYRRKNICRKCHNRKRK